MTQRFLWALVVTSQVEHCSLLTRMCYPSQSTWPLILYRNETSYLLYTIPVQNVVRFHTGMKVLYRYENQSELVPVQHFVPVSCKWIESYKWALEWTFASMTFRSATFGSACQYNILNWYYVNKYRATVGTGMNLYWNETHTSIM